MPRPKPVGIVVHAGRYATVATLEEIQMIWASVSEDPAISTYCLAQQTGIKKTKVHHILKFLERAGILQHKPHHTGRTVRIPMIWI